jgi:hypothetical protein
MIGSIFVNNLLRGLILMSMLSKMFADIAHVAGPVDAISPVRL